MKVLVGAFNQEKALVGAFSVIVKSLRNFVYNIAPPITEERSRPAVSQIQRR